MALPSLAGERQRTVSAEEEQEKTWVELTFNKRECTKFVPVGSSSQESISRCGCGRLLSNHNYLNAPRYITEEENLPLGATAKTFSAAGKQKALFYQEETNFNQPEFIPNLVFDKTQEDTRWNVMKNTSCWPTDAHGTLEFQGTGEGDKSQYIRLSHDTSPDLVLQLMIDEWKLQPPHMVISVHGGTHNLQLQPKLMRVISNGLIKAAKTTGAWIMSFGLNMGIGAIVGNALKEHKAKSRGKVFSIGVAPWGVVDHREDLIGSQSIKSYQTMANPLSKGSVLHAAHTHFLLVDNGTEGRYDTEIRFRRQLEKKLSQHRINPRSGHNCSIVCLVLEGGKNTINVVLESVKQNPPIPVIVCDGSGRAADLIAFAHQYADDDGFMIEELRLQLLVLIEDTFKCRRDQAQYIFISIMECIKKKDLITIFRMGQGSNQDDIDIAILTATLKAQCKSAPDMLNLALAWNRIDIATSQIFVYGRQWPVLSLEQAMMDALIADRVEFVKLLMENGVSMHKFLTVHRLEELYNATPLPVNVVYLMNDVKKNIPPGYRFTLTDIGLVIELLMGGAYRCSYTRKRFRLYYASKNKPATGMKKQLSFRIGLPNIGQMTSSSTRTDLFNNPTTDAMTHDSKSNSASPNLPKDFPYPFNELLMWALIMKRQKMALFMWQQGEEAIAKALVACKLYKAMAKEAADDDLDVEESDQLKAYSKEFQDLAIQLLEVCYHADDDATQHILTYELKQWSRHTCLSLAVAAKHRDFIAHPCVQLLLNDLWMGGLSMRKNSSLKVILGILLPPTILMLEFKTHEELQLMPQTVAEHLHEVSSVSSSVEGSSSSSSSVSSSSSSSSGRSVTSGALPKPDILGRDISEQRGEDAYVILTMRRKQIGFRKKVYEFYNAPITKFWMHTMLYTVILSLFTFVVLVRLENLPSIYEWIVISHAITVTIEKVREIVVSEPSGTKQKVKIWCGKFWNLVEVLTLSMFFIGLGLRLSNDPYLLKVGRAIYCANIVLWYSHLLNIFSVSKYLGPYVTLMGKMMVDLGTFIILLAVVLASFGVARQAVLHPNETAKWSLLKDVALEPYFMLYGEVYAGTIDPCSADNYDNLCSVGSWIAPTFMTIYLLVANILLLNLLIAVFNNTFARVKTYSDRIWKFQRYLMIVEYELRPVLPPPLILISYISMIIGRIFKKRKSSSSDRGLKLFLDDDDVEKLHDFEEDCVDEFFRSRNQNNPTEAVNKNYDRDRLTRLLDSVEEMRENESNLLNHLSVIHERLAYLEDINIKLLDELTQDKLKVAVEENQSTLEEKLHSVSERRMIRQRSRVRNDSEMSSVSEWLAPPFIRMRNKSSDKSKPATLQPLTNNNLVRRTNSMGGINHSNEMLNQKNPAFNQINDAWDETKSSSCQDIMIRGNLKPSSSERNAPQNQSVFQSNEVASNPAIIVEKYPVYSDNEDRAWFDQTSYPTSNHVNHENNDFSFAPANTTPNIIEAASTSANVEEISKSGKRRYSMTPTITISTPGGRPVYKSITDNIDTSRWHEMHAPHVPSTPFDGWWNGKAPDFDSRQAIKYNDQISLSDWEEEKSLLQTKRRHKKKSPGKHRKKTHMKHKRSLSALNESISSHVNLNNNSNDHLSASLVQLRDSNSLSSLTSDHNNITTVIHSD
uniref:transient receptor potential cation channel subfamily M member 1-like isoform X2 n=1 Tax=Ciona intestinalis TaxID=7719 RepID=UPI00089DB76F|nr:transient receptor potential cation channel subfamily M member 1-like isoform X2 [Ciona intestinalis]|eukprot:XP_018667447.1 transient receptor potential cation channel subfamily M member 1-like isoform X2 [Ciona intestinalis]